MIPVDLDKTYKLSAWMRTLDKRFPASAFFGLRMYDKDKRPININNVAVCPATETTLAAAAAKDMKELSVVKNVEWLKVASSAVAFNIEDNYQDLPNSEVFHVDKIIDENVRYKVILRTPLKKAYPEGTKVRLHSPWDVPLYFVAEGWMPTEWKQFSTTIKGEAKSGIPKDKFWRGTKYVRVFAWFGNYDRIPEKDARLLVDDISFVCREQTAAERIIEQQWEKFVDEQQTMAVICDAASRAEKIDKQWHFATDVNDEGLHAGWMRADFADQDWPYIDADRWWQEQGYPDYHGVAWYRKTINPVAEGSGRSFINFGAVDGDVIVFLNGRKVGERNLHSGGIGWDSPLYFEITGYLASGRKNVVAVRVKKTEHKSGIFKGVKIINVKEKLLANE